jgi:hypothetical protein
MSCDPKTALQLHSVMLLTKTQPYIPGLLVRQLLLPAAAQVLLLLLLLRLQQHSLLVPAHPKLPAPTLLALAQSLDPTAWPYLQ